MDPKTNTYFSTTLEKGLSILTLFNQDRVKCTMTELSSLSGINKTSTYRFVNTLVQLGYLRREKRTKLIKLGAKAITLGHGFLRGFDLLQMIKPLVDDAHERFGITVDTALLDGSSVLVVYRREAGNNLTYRLPTVTKSLHSSALGKAILAHQSDTEIESFLESKPLIRKTDNTIVDKDQFREELKNIRKNGYSVNREEYIPGLIAIGAPLVNIDTEKVIGAICFDLNTIQMSVDEMVDKYSSTIITLAKKISEVMPIL